MIDLLPLVKDYAKQSGNSFLKLSKEKNEEFMSEFYTVIYTIRNELTMLTQIVEKIKISYSSEKSLDTIFKDTNTIILKLRKMLDDCRYMFVNNDVARRQIQENIVTALISQFSIIVGDYQETETRYRDDKEKSNFIELRLRNPNRTQGELIQLKNDEESRNYIMRRENEIYALEHNLKEVHQLFIDMANLVDRQNEVLNRVAHRVATSRGEITEAKGELRAGHHIRRRTCSIQ